MHKVNERLMFTKLTEAITHLVVELRELRQAMSLKDELRQMERRIIAAIQSGGTSAEDQALLDQQLKRQERITKRFEALDAMTPPR